MQGVIRRMMIDLGVLSLPRQRESTRAHALRLKVHSAMGVEGIITRAMHGMAVMSSSKGGCRPSRAYD